MFFNRILVSGANGLLGQAVVRRLSTSSNYTVLATARDDHLRFDASCDYAAMDITTPDEVASVIEQFDPSVVVNCAAVSDIAECDQDRNRAWAVNARGPKTLAKYCRNARAKLVHLSSDFIFNGKRGPYDEDARPDPVNYYGRTKLAGENAVRTAGYPNWAIVRTVLLYGTGQNLTRTNIVRWMIDRLSAGKPVHAVDDQWRTPTFVPDLAEGIERLIDADKTGIFHMSGRELVTIYELAQTVADVFDFDLSLIHPVPTDYFEEDVERPPKTGFIILKAETELEYDPHSLDGGIRKMGDQLGVRTAS